MRWPTLQLRPRIVGALVLTSAVTLLVAAVALLSPLEQRLRRDELQTLSDATLAARPGFERLPTRDLVQPSPRLLRLTRSLRHRAGAGVAVVRGDGRLIHPRGGEQGEELGSSLDVRRALSLRRPVRTITRIEGEDEARIALAVRRRSPGVVLVVGKPLNEAAAAVRVVRSAFVTAGLAGLAVAVLVGVFLAARLVRRIRRLREAAVEVAELGPTANVDVDSARDEVGDLSRAFAHMQARLREQEEARRTFVSTASHELRTPLASLELMLDLLDEDLAGDSVDVEETREQVQRAQAHARRLSKLASQLLDLSRVDAGVPLRTEQVELCALVHSVVGELEPRAAALEVGLEIAGTDPLWVAADPGAVARIVRILLDNALRFAPQGSTVELRLETGARRALLTVTDQGPGVPEPERDSIFERFYRGRSPGAGAGFGLGLALGRELARQMKGGLALEATATGAAFTLTLPPDHSAAGLPEPARTVPG